MSGAAGLVPIPKTADRTASPCGCRGSGADATAVPTVARVVNESQARRFVIQDFRPLAESLDWELGQIYFAKHGRQSFLSGGVPYVVHNDGALSSRAAQLLFAALDGGRDGRPGGRIFVVELGAGLGLFARLFLDSFQELCARLGADYYSRLVYVAADRSERMLADLDGSRILSGHEGHYRLASADACGPAASLAGVLQESPRAVFLNYLLDCLPAALLKTGNGGLTQLHVRTCLSRTANLAEYTTASAEDLVRMAESSDPREKLPLVDLYHQFGLDYEYRADGVGDLPYLSHALSQPGETILHSFGALRALEELRRLLSPGGFILASDYPWLQHPLERLPYQHFGGSTAIGVNFPLLESYFQRDPEVTWIEPEGRQAGARLLGWRLAPAVAACFGNLFSAEALRWEAEPLENARKYRESGRTDAAHCSYTEALRRQPRNWALIAEAARFLVSQVQDYPAGLALARAAIELNPIHPDPWNTLGDAHFALGQIEEARSAFERAVEIRPDDVRGYYNLMYTCSKRGDLRAALRMAAEALAHDRSGEYRDQILQRQSEILAHLRRLSAERENRLRDR